MENSNGEHYTPGKCMECREGEHEDYSESGMIVRVYDLDGKFVRRGYLCDDHIDSNLTYGICKLTDGGGQPLTDRE